MKKLLNLTRLTTLTSALAVSVFTLVGCDVDADAPEVPEVDVEVTGGELPEFDVEGPDLETGTTTVEVPTVGIDLPEEGDADAGESEAKQELEAETGY